MHVHIKIDSKFKLNIAKCQRCGERSKRWTNLNFYRGELAGLQSTELRRYRPTIERRLPELSWYKGGNAIFFGRLWELLSVHF